jgi:histidinol-phosphate aminotransferase
VETENLVIGNGGEELLSLIAQTFINEGDEVIVASPSFGIYNTTTSLLGGVIRTVPFKDQSYDIRGFLDAITDKTKLIYICSPNNPTGNIVDVEALDILYNGLPEHVVVVLDEAYYEFASVNPDYPDGLAYLKRRPLTVILRTFSKIYGIAGLRVGYLITSPMLAKELNKAKLTFNVNRLAQEGARGALRDVEFKDKTVTLNYQSMKRMEEFFDQKGLAYIKSYANFIFVDVKHHSKMVFEELLKRGVIIRPGYFWGWDNWIRVSTGTLEQTEKFVQRLQEVLEQQ